MFFAFFSLLYNQLNTNKKINENISKHFHCLTIVQINKEFLWLNIVI